MNSDVHAQLARTVGLQRAERTRWLLALLADPSLQAPRDEIAAALTPSNPIERFLQLFAFFQRRLGAFSVDGARVVDDGVVEVALRDAKERPWTLRCLFEQDPPERIARCFLGRPLPPSLRIRAATEADAAAIAAIERACPIERDDGSRVMLERGRSLFDQIRLADRGFVWIAEDDGVPVACDARAHHRARVAGRAVSLGYRFHTRVAPSHRRLGLNEALAGFNSEAVFRAGLVEDGLYVYVDPGNQVIRDWSPNTPWRVRPFRALLRCDAIASSPAGRAATEADAARVAALLNAAHEREELFVPYDAARLTDRLTRAPDCYGFAQVQLADGAVVGVWEDRERRVLERDGARDESLRATVIDWGFDPTAHNWPAALERLLRGWCGRLAERGFTHLSIFASHASPAAPLLRALAESVVDVEMQLMLPEPADTDQRGIYVDPVYY